MNIYVGNLSYEAADEDLQAAFSAHGTVQTATVVMDRYTGRSRGFGFVEMPDPDQGRAAIAALNGTELKGRPLRLDEARPRSA